MAKNIAALRNKNRSRPRKGTAGRRRRMKTQVARLVKLGEKAEAVKKLNAIQLRTKLAKTVRLAQKAARKKAAK